MHDGPYKLKLLSFQFSHKWQNSKYIRSHDWNTDRQEVSPVSLFLQIDSNEKEDCVPLCNHPTTWQMPIVQILTSNVTSRHRTWPKSEAKASEWLQSAVTTTHVLSMPAAGMWASSIFHRRLWYHALSLRYACIRSSGIIPNP